MRGTLSLSTRNREGIFANKNGDSLHAAFDKKSAVHPGASGRPPDPESIGGVWRQVMAREGNGGRNE